MMVDATCSSLLPTLTPDTGQGETTFRACGFELLSIPYSACSACMYMYIALACIMVYVFVLGAHTGKQTCSWCASQWFSGQRNSSEFVHTIIYMYMWCLSCNMLCIYTCVYMPRIALTLFDLSHPSLPTESCVALNQIRI